MTDRADCRFTHVSVPLATENFMDEPTPDLICYTRYPGGLVVET